VPFDSDQAPVQKQLRATDPRPLATEGRKSIHWGAIISQWWLDISFEHAERVLMEPKTRDQLNGRFFHEWLDDVAQYRYGLWSDGDKFFTSYIGHPLQGAVVEGIFWQNDDRVRFSEQDFHSAAYRKALLQAFAFAAVDAVQLIMNEVGGTAMTIGFQWVDKHFQKPLENRIQSRALIDTMRIFTNPPQSLANFFRFRTPWYRDNRP
jgi:hypothetical protein